MNTVAPLRAWVYARRSQKQDNQASVTDQVAAGREVCDSNCWELAGVIDKDFDRSASRFARQGRPGWVELLTAIRGGLVDVVILWESSRGDRKLTGWSEFLDLCRERGILIHVWNHERTYNLRIAADWKTLATDGVDAAYEAEKISNRVKRGKRSAAARGEPWPRPPYGYKAFHDPDSGKRKGWETIPERAEIARFIIIRVGEHKALQEIRRDLEARGVPSPGGGAWTHQQIRFMALNHTYAGLLRLHDGTLIDGNWPPIVTRAEWEAAMAVLRPRMTGTRPGAQRHLMSYLGECWCGRPLVSRRPRGNDSYSCRKGCFYIPEKWLDELVADVICERLARPDARDLFRADDSRSEQLRNELAGLRRQLDEWAAADISARAYAIKEAKLLPQIEAKQRELDALTIPPALAGILSAADVRAAWNTYSVQARRAIIAAVSGVEVIRGPAPDDVPAAVLHGKVWIRFTGKPAHTHMHAAERG